jgi:16S rRNA (guanine527-N7)-methyltransferase
METQVEQFKRALADHGPSFGLELQQLEIERLAAYYELVLKWNPGLHLVAPCSADAFALRHVLESLFLLKHLPLHASIADVGSGAGLPMIPCLSARPDLRGILIESSRRKAVFLREALRTIESTGRAKVIAARFEDVEAPDVDFVTCRALDKFSELVPKLAAWTPIDAKLLLFGGESIRAQAETMLILESVELIPQSERRFLIVAGRPAGQPPN